ncbi:hypothetical protein BN1708_015105, partial [Verticillium longisporum]
ELDLPKLQSLPADQQQLFLLTSVAALTKHVLALSNDDCTAQQFYLKKEVFQIINLTTPQPTRVVRNNLGKCLAHIFGHGDRKLLFETINDLVSITQGGKGKAESSQRAKHAAVVLCNACGNAFTNHEIKYLVDTIVANREPSARAGCAMAMGSIQKQVGATLTRWFTSGLWRLWH